MIRLGTQIRLTAPEVAYFLWLTNLEPVGIRTLADFQAYVMQCKAHYWGVSEETQFLHRRIDEAAAHCLAS